MSWRERVFIITSNTEAVEVVYCGLCGKHDFHAENCDFGCGAVCGKALFNHEAYPHSPYTPQSTHCVHRASPQIVDLI